MIVFIFGEKDKPLSSRSKSGVCSRSEQKMRWDKHYHHFLPFYRLRWAPCSSHWPSSFSALRSIQVFETRSSRFHRQPGKYKIIQGCLISRTYRILNFMWFQHQFTFWHFFRRSTSYSNKRELCWSRVGSFLGLLGILKMGAQWTDLPLQWSDPWKELQNDFFQKYFKSRQLAAFFVCRHFILS